jgi:catechol 2,3-dioxygenase-like lactoylglutathione lyase family enzyme
MLFRREWLGLSPRAFSPNYAGSEKTQARECGNSLASYFYTFQGLPKRAGFSKPMFKMTHPILGTRDSKRAIEFYTRQLGFQLVFGDKTDPPNYVGFRRDAVELHMQFQFEHEMGTIRLRFLVENPDALFNEYRERGVECSANGIRDTSWGTREFALYDMDRNALTFYRNLTNTEKEHEHAA